MISVALLPRFVELPQHLFQIVFRHSDSVVVSGQSVNRVWVVPARHPDRLSDGGSISVAALQDMALTAFFDDLSLSTLTALLTRRMTPVVSVGVVGRAFSFGVTALVVSCRTAAVMLWGGAGNQQSGSECNDEGEEVSERCCFHRIGFLN